MRVFKSTISKSALASLLIGLVFTLGSASVSNAATLTVTSTADSGAGSLREAIASANAAAGADAIVFNLRCPKNKCTISLTGGGLDILEPLTITGPGASRLTIDANGLSNIFYVSLRTSVSISGLTLTGGRNEDTGGAIAVDYEGSLDLTGMVLAGNTAIRGGAIGAGGTVTVSNSVISNNSAVTGGGIFLNFTSAVTLTDSTVSGNTAINGGGIYGSYEIGNPNVIVNRSTFSNNCAGTRATPADSCGATGSGGAIYFVNFDVGPFNISNSTFSNNSAAFGGGLYYANSPGHFITSSTFFNSSINNEGLSGLFAPPTLLNTIVSGGGCTVTGGGSVPVDGGFNIDSGTSCGFSSASNSMPSTDPLLGPLQDNGGPTDTFALLFGSPAIDAIGMGLNGCGESGQTDQRGVSRPQGTGCDIGAFEFVAKKGRGKGR